MGTVATNFLPNATGLDLGSTGQRWDAFLQNADISGTVPSITATSITTDSFSAETTNNIRWADRFPGATADVKINAAITDLPATGGIVDCRGFANTTQTIAAQVAVGSATKRVTLIFDARTLFNITVATGVVVFPISDGSCVTADPILGAQNFNGVNGFTLVSGANVASIFAPAPSVTGGVFALRGVTMINRPGSACSNGLIALSEVFLGSFLQDVTVYMLAAGIGLHITQGTLGTSDVEILNCQVNGTNVAGTRPVVITGNGSTQQASGINFTSCGFQHAGTGQYEIEIDGLNGGVGGVPGVQSIVFVGYHHESAGGSLGIKIRDAANIFFIPGFSTSGTGANNVLTISESVASIVQNIQVATSYEIGSATNWVVNSCVGGTTIATANATYMPEYRFNSSLTMTGAISLYGNISSQKDNTFLAWDGGGGDRIGFGKKTGAQGKIVHGSAVNLVIAQSAGTSIDPANAYTNQVEVDSTGNVLLDVGVLDTKTGGSTTIAAGVGSVRMSSANPGTNAVWIPMKYNGTTYFIPGWTTNSP